MKFRFGLFAILCLISIMLCSCFFENDVVPKIANNNIDVKTTFGDELHFDISTSANMHHQFINYRITLSSVTESEHSVVNIVLREQPETVYENPLLNFTEVLSEDNISLYKLEDNYIFVYGSCIATYSTDDGPFMVYSEKSAIKRFKEIMGT